MLTIMVLRNIISSYVSLSHDLSSHVGMSRVRRKQNTPRMLRCCLVRYEWRRETGTATLTKRAVPRGPAKICDAHSIQIPQRRQNSDLGGCDQQTRARPPRPYWSSRSMTRLLFYPYPAGRSSSLPSRAAREYWLHATFHQPMIRLETMNHQNRHVMSVSLVVQFTLPKSQNIADLPSACKVSC